ncbi:alkaline phosphatase [Mollicutes bacterium LVI A0039]|nr:alkaline phosphatase [Mollicutes bacterium LVI A0039]
MRKLLIICIFLVTLSGCGVGTTSASVTSTKPKYVLFYIGDGMGVSQRTLAEYYQDYMGEDKLEMNHLPQIGMYSTKSNNSYIPDSAATATAMSAGKTTNNGQVSTQPLNDNQLTADNAEQEAKTLEDIDNEADDMINLGDGLHEAGIPMGVITTTRITHATPAAFTSHSNSRNDEALIAEQQLEFAPELIAGGGTSYLIPQTEEGSKRSDDRNLIDEYTDKGYTYFNDLEQFTNDVAATETPVVATFDNSHMDYEIDTPNDSLGLSEMTEASIDYMYNNYQEGFFMMIEGGRIDHAAHANDAPTLVQETLEFEDSIKAGLEFYQEHADETLIVVGADHETGGLGLGDESNYFMNLGTLDDYEGSTEVMLQGYYKQGMDHNSVLDYLEKEFGLTNLTDKEKKMLTDVMTRMDNTTPDPDNGYIGIFYEDYGSYDPLATVVNQITSDRANVGFTTHAHTGTFVEASAIGVGAENFDGMFTNEDIGLTLAELLEVKTTGTIEG